MSWFLGSSVVFKVVLPPSLRIFLSYWRARLFNKARHASSTFHLLSLDTTLCICFWSLFLSFSWLDFFLKNSSLYIALVIQIPAVTALVLACCVAIPHLWFFRKTFFCRHIIIFLSKMQITHRLPSICSCLLPSLTSLMPSQLLSVRFIWKRSVIYVTLQSKLMYNIS